MTVRVYSDQHTFQTAAVAHGNGTVLECGGFGSLGIQIEGIAGDTITFEGTLDDTTWYAIQAVNANDGSIGTTATADGIYKVSLVGLLRFRCRLAFVGGSVTVTGLAVTQGGITLADIDIAGAEIVEVEQATHDTLNANVNLQVGDADVDSTNPVNSLGSWRASLQVEETVDDSDKTFTVPASTEWQILWIWAELITTATVGDRQLVVEIQDTSNDVIGQFRVGVVQPASITRYYQFGASMADLQAYRDTDWLSTPLPPGLILQAGDQLRVYDNAAVDAAADDMVLQMQIASRSV